MAELMTEREYAHSLGLAKLGRGKFSSEAKAAIAKAKAEGMEFRSTAYVPTGKPRGRKANPVSATHVITNLKTTSESGEVTDNVIKQRPKVSEVKAPAPKAASARTREETVMHAISKGMCPGHSDLVITLDSCAGCGHSISRCTHNQPLLPKYLGGGEGLLIRPVLNVA